MNVSQDMSILSLITNASVLVQIGLLDPTGLPVVGAEGARRVRDPRLPVRVF